VRIIVVDTDVFVAALLGPGGSSREVIRRCLKRQYLPVMGSTLLSEYDAVMEREQLFANAC
jgi:predicted nucleic acid-binding protein